MKLLLNRRLAGGAILPVIIGIIVLSLGALIWEWHSTHAVPEKQEKPVSTSSHHHKGKKGKAKAEGATKEKPAP